MAQRLTVLAALTENLDLVPRMHTVTKHTSDSDSRESETFFSDSTGNADICAP